AARERRPIALTVQCVEGNLVPSAERRFFVVRRMARRALIAAREAAPVVETSNPVFNNVHEGSSEDLAMLMTEKPHGAYPYAGMYWQRTRDAETIEAIWPNVKAALDWIERSGDRDGDGFVEYDRKRSSGLRNQGWKDSDDAVFHADGALAEPPIALCEVQGYVYLAYRLAALLAADMEDYPLSAGLTLKAEKLRRQFEETYWDE